MTRHLKKLKKLKWSSKLKKLTLEDFQYQFNKFCKKSYYGWISNVSGRLLFNLNEPLNYRLDRIVGDIYTPVNTEIQYATTMLVDLRNLSINKDLKYTRIFFITNKFESHDSINDCKAINGTFYFLNHRQDDPIKKDTDLLKQFIASDNNSALVEFHKKLTSSDCKATHYLHELEVKIECDGFVSIEDRVKGGSIDATQAFIFIKYLFHKHVFHAVTLENISRLVLCDGDKSKTHEKILFSMKKQISELMNAESSNPATLHDLKGVINYIRTFLSVSSINKNLIDKETIYLKNMEDSLSNALVERPYKPTNMHIFSEDLQRFIPIVLAVLAPYMVIKSKIIDKNGYIDVANNFLDHFYLPYYFVVFAGLFYITLIINLLSNKYNNSYVTSFLHWLSNAILRYIKNKNKPTMGSKFSKYVLQNIINFEMNIRRGSKKQKTRYIIVGLVVLLVGIVSGLAIEYPERLHIIFNQLLY